MTDDRSNEIPVTNDTRINQSNENTKEHEAPSHDESDKNENATMPSEDIIDNIENNSNNDEDIMIDDNKSNDDQYNKNSPSTETRNHPYMKRSKFGVRPQIVWQGLWVGIPICIGTDPNVRNKGIENVRTKSYQCLG